MYAKCTDIAINASACLALVLSEAFLCRMADRTPCYALFIDPALGCIGMTDTQARATLAQGRKVLHTKMPMQRVGRAYEAGETLGFMKVLVDADNKVLLGAAVVCFAPIILVVYFRQCIAGLDICCCTY
jgi:pyruvate/2-oxoglutarate dehydrogenase complex dihydrolipoamide dehydrogenase (E3) component